MLLETVLIKSLYLYQALERLFVYLRQTDTHTHTHCRSQLKKLVTNMFVSLSD